MEIAMIIKPKELKIRKFVHKPNIRKSIIEATDRLMFLEFDRIEEKYDKQLKELLEDK